MGKKDRREFLKDSFFGSALALCATTLGLRPVNSVEASVTVPNTTSATSTPPQRELLEVQEYTGWRRTNWITPDGRRSFIYEEVPGLRPSFDEVNGSKAKILRMQRRGV